MRKKADSDTISLNSNVCSSSCDESRRSSSRVSLYSKSVLSLPNAECKTKTEDSYVFEAGYMLNLAARCEDMGDYQRAFECYKSGIEKMLIGVQSEYTYLIILMYIISVRFSRHAFSFLFMERS